MEALQNPQFVAALAALLFAGAYAWRGRTSDQTRLIKSTLARLANVEQENKNLKARLEAVAREFREYREAVSSGHTPPHREPSQPTVRFGTQRPEHAGAKSPTQY